MQRTSKSEEENVEDNNDDGFLLSWLEGRSDGEQDKESGEVSQPSPQKKGTTK